MSPIVLENTLMRFGKRRHARNIYSIEVSSNRSENVTIKKDISNDVRNGSFNSDKQQLNAVRMQ